MSKNILIIGFGDIGRRVKSKLDDKYVVYAINRNPKKEILSEISMYLYVKYRIHFANLQVINVL